VSEASGEQATRAVHGPEAPRPGQVPLGLPVYRTTAYRHASAKEYAQIVADVTGGYVYSRIDNPTADAFASGIAAMEGAEAGQPFASGMAAIATVLSTLTGAGAHIVAPKEAYGGTYALITTVLARFGVSHDLVDFNDLAAVEAALRPGETTVVWAESIANPTLSVADLPALASLAHGAGALLVVDSTFATPVVCRPLEHGADLVVHSATKYLGGHSDATGGVAVGAAELVSRVRAERIQLGGCLAPDEAFLLHRGLATLPLRVERHCSSALTVARALTGHPRVARVDYPGLAGHRSYELARALFDPGRFGGVVTVSLDRPEVLAAEAFCDALRLVTIATSLGGTHSVVSPVATTTHRQFGPQELAAAGISPSTVRISIGLEDPGDIVADVTAALELLP
jgi:cystathionine beta-lyase/cystathionine gamma-synthase